MKIVVRFFVVLAMSVCFAHGILAGDDDCLIKVIKDLGNGNWEITVSLEGLPEGEVFMSGQIYPDGPWQADSETEKFSIIDNEDETATIIIHAWPTGEYFYFSYGRGDWSSTKKGWVNPECSRYKHKNKDGSWSFRLKLGIKPLAPPVDFRMIGSSSAIKILLLTPCQIPAVADTGDSVVLGVESLGGAKYRLYLNFDGLTGSQKFFVGEKAPNDAWEKKSVQQIKKCQVVDISWDYPGQKIYFSWYAQSGGKQNWADAEGGGSRFATCIDGEGHKQFCLDPAQVVAELTGN